MENRPASAPIQAIRERLKAAREKKKWNASQLAKEIYRFGYDVSAGTIKNVESGAYSSIDVALVFAVAEACDESPAYMLGLTPDSRELLTKISSRLRERPGGIAAIARELKCKPGELTALLSGQSKLNFGLAMALGEAAGLSDTDMEALRVAIGRPASLPKTEGIPADPPTWAQEIITRMDRLEQLISQDRKHSNALRTTTIDETGGGDFIAEPLSESYVGRYGLKPFDPSLSSVIRVPLLGHIHAGQPTQAQQNIEREIDVRGVWSKPGVFFALRVQGTSMINAGIQDSDIVIVRHREGKPDLNEIVAVTVDSATALKRYTKKSGRFVLAAENAAHPDIEAGETVPQGVVIGVLREGG